MPTMCRALLRASVILLALVVVAGCAKNDRRLPVYQARGRVLVNGKPAKGVIVYLWPASTEGVDAYCPNGQTDENGEFALSTYTSGDGAPAGVYKITAEWPVRFNPITNRWEGDRFKKRFADQNKSTLSRTIEKKANELEELKFDE